MVDRCFACTEPKELTREHIIPQSIGGRLKAKLYCKECNAAFSHELDDEIARQCGPIATLLNIKRDRGRIQPFTVTETLTGTELLFDGKAFRRRNPKVKKTSKDGMKLDSVDITARSEAELRKICSSIRARYELSGDIQTYREDHPGPTVGPLERTIDSTLLRRGACKTAYSFLCTKAPKAFVFSSAFDEVRAYIKVGDSPDLACGNYVDTQFMTDSNRPLHRIHIVFNSTDRIVVGYVCLFGMYRFTVLLSERFNSALEWPELDYSFDPLRHEEVRVNIQPCPSSITKKQVLHPKQSREFVLSELHKGQTIIARCVDGYEFLHGGLR